MKFVLTIAIFLVLSVSGRSQLGPCAEIKGPLLPDLVVNAKVMSSSLFTVREYFGPCEAIEAGGGMVEGAYTVVRFSTQTENRGPVSMVLGAPVDCATIFAKALCSPNGWHAISPHAFRLWTLPGYDNWVKNRDLSLVITGTKNETLLKAALASGELLKTNRKLWYDFEDYTHYDKSRGPSKALFTDEFQGLSPGWADIYNAKGFGQFIIIDGVPKGQYMIEVQINPDHVLPESDYKNNSTGVKWNWLGKV